jgi:phage shock protein PspC (stress-responsive transcriptional regulator)
MEEENQPYELKRSLEINPSEKFLMGVCSAFGNFINVNPVIIRLIVLITFYFLGPPIVLIYSAFGILLPVRESQEVSLGINHNKITLNILFIGGIVLLILLFNDVIYVKNIFETLSQKVDAFSLLVFSIALLINNHHKVELNMLEEKSKQLRKSDKKVFFGICAGFAEFLNVNPYLIRLIGIIFFFATFGFAALIYLALNFVIPSKSEMS